MRPEIQIIIVCAICVMSIIGYGSFRCTHSGYTDPLTKAFVPPPFDKYLDGWGLLHFGFFFGLAYVHPDHVGLIWSLGLSWELLEFWSKDHPFYISECKLSTSDGGGWWYGRWEDVVMNSIGIGAALALRVSQDNSYISTQRSTFS